MILFNFFSASKPSKPYLSTLSQTELEKVGLKAVAAGANPQQLQQAFATAQLQGDWSKLEKLISDELGVAAINPAETGLAAAAQSTGAFSQVFHDCLIDAVGSSKIFLSYPKFKDVTRLIKNPEWFCTANIYIGNTMKPMHF